MNSIHGKLLTTREVAEIINSHRSHVLNLIGRRELEAIRLGKKKWVVDSAVLDKWLECRKTTYQKALYKARKGLR